MEHARHSRVRAAGISRRWLWLALGMLLLVGGAASLRPAAAQEVAAAATVSAGELEEIVGPIALYPDDLVAIVLPASTYPLQVVQAARFLEDRKANASLEPDKSWDESVIALLNYPEVVKLLNDDLDWMYDLGTAVLNQRPEVLDAIQAFRDRAYAAGNLRSDEQQTVTRADKTIEIKPADPQVIYVPYYEPERVVVYQSAPVYHYYPWRYPLYYYPYPSHYVFDTGFFWGVRSWYSVGWHTHHVHVHHWGYHGHPYFGWTYYDPWYVRNAYINVNLYPNHVWTPNHRYGGRPAVRGYEGRVYTANEPPRTGGGMAGGAYRSRSTEGRATAPAANGSALRTTETDRVARGMAGGAYRNRSVEATGQARAAAEASQPSTTTRSHPALRQRPSTAAPGAASTVVGSGQTSVATRERTYRSGGMAQALERSRAAPTPQVSRPVRTTPSRSMGDGSTAMPREASRAIQSRESAASIARPSGGGMSAAQRSDGGSRADAGGGSPRAESGGGNYRSHPAARGGAPR
jgi:hypothetical protein